MATNFWFKFYFKEWANDAKPLSLMARGLLMELIIYLKQCDPPGEMPVDIRLIARLSGGLTEEISESLTEYKKCGTFNFEDRAGQPVLISRRIKREIQLSAVNQVNGKLGGNPRLSGSVNRRLKRSPNSNSISNSISISLNNSECFEDFWTLYDKKVGDKNKLIKKWAELAPDEIEKIMQFIPKYKTAEPNKKFRKNPETFLNNKSWNDEIINTENYATGTTKYQSAHERTKSERNDLVAKSEEFIRKITSGEI